MELKVWVEGIQRIVCGVTDATTCQDVVYVLVHATGKTGRFMLVEKWRNNERLLPPHEHPLKVLSKWGEYASDVQLVLRRSATEIKGEPSDGGGTKLTQDSFHDFSPPPSGSGTNHHKPQVPPSAKDGPIRKSLTFSGGRPNHGDAVVGPKERRDWSEVPRGVVKGVPQQMVKDQEAPLKELHPPPGKDGGGRTMIMDSFNPSERSPPGHGVARGKDSKTTSKIPGPQVPRCGHHQPVHTVRSADAAVGPPQGPRILLPPDVLRQNGTNGPRLIRVAGEQNVSTSSTKQPGGGWSPSQEPRPITSPNPNGDGSRHSPKQAAPVRAMPNSNGDGPKQAPAPSSARRNELQNPRLPSEQQPNQYGGFPGSSLPNGQVNGPYGNSGSRTLAAPPGVGTGNKESPCSNGPYSPRSPSTNPVPIHMGTPKSRRNLLSEFKRHDLEEELREDSFLGRGHQERVVYDARYRELVRLINLQREKLSHQQVDLTQFDAEISYWEEKQKDHQRQIEVIEREIQKNEFCGRDVDEEIVQLDKLHLDDELEIGRQQEKMLQSELTLLRSKLSNCETELLQCKNKMRLLLDDISEDKRWLSKEDEDRKQREVAIMNDIEDLQREIQEVFKGYSSKVNTWEKVEQDVHRLEMAIADKKKQVEGLVREMKEANLESLAFTPAEEIRHLLEGGAPKGPGSSRKIVGSPRQLENAVPTSKNPHGVWV